MTEIKRIKQLLIDAKKVDINNIHLANLTEVNAWQKLKNDALSIISALITTIESQNEEIEKEREYVTIKQRQLNGALAEIESLKAITELAVKGLKEISDGGSTGEDARDMRRTADYTLSEIERLSHELDK